MSNFDLYSSMPEGESATTKQGKPVGYEVDTAVEDGLKVNRSKPSASGAAPAAFVKDAPLRAGGIASTLGNQVEPLNNKMVAGGKPLSVLTHH